MRDWDRRTFLSSIGATGLAGLAGCGGRTSSDADAEPPPDQAEPTPSPSTDTKTASRTATPDTTPPTIEEFDVTATESKGVLSVSVMAADDLGLSRGVVQTSVEAVEKVLDGQQDSFETPMSGSPGKIERVQLLLEDESGNRTSDATDSYVRKYTKSDEVRLDLGTHYLPQMGAAFENGCVVGKVPLVGVYEDPIQPITTSRHIDQMTGHGVGRIIYSYEGFGRSPERLRTFLDSDLVSQIELEPEISWNVFSHSMNQSWKDSVVPETTSVLRNQILKRENVAVYDGRPVINTWAWHAFAGGEARDKVMDEWSSFRAFVRDVRSQLTVNDSEPFLIGGMDIDGWATYDNQQIRKVARQFDAVTDWFPAVNLHAGDTYEWQAALSDTEESFRMHRDFAEQNQLAFIPNAFPGEDDRGNDCWGPEGKRLIPRSPDHFRQILELARQYATTDRINIATWNDWAEGTQIEPGTHRGSDYGTEYLAIVNETQQRGG